VAKVLEESPEVVPFTAWREGPSEGGGKERWAADEEVGVAQKSAPGSRHEKRGEVDWLESKEEPL